MLRKNTGFTLIEILTAIVILTILAGLAVPNYFRTMEQARSNEARVNLQIILMGEKVYLLNNNTFWPPGGPANATLSDINANLNIDIATPQYYTLAVSATTLTGTAATFLATATRGNTGDKAFAITQTGVITEVGSY